MGINQINKTIEFVEQNRLPMDKIYLNQMITPPFLYYQSILTDKVETNLAMNSHTTVWNNHAWLTDMAVFAEDLKGLKGRTWFLFTDTGDQTEKAQFLKNYFLSRGKHFVLEAHFIGSDAYLYNINE